MVFVVAVVDVVAVFHVAIAAGVDVNTVATVAVPVVDVVFIVVIRPHHPFMSAWYVRQDVAMTHKIITQCAHARKMSTRFHGFVE